MDVGFGVQMVSLLLPFPPFAHMKLASRSIASKQAGGCAEERESLWAIWELPVRESVPLR